MADIDKARSHLRRAAIRRALYLVWPRPMGLGLIAEALTDDLSGDPEGLCRDLDYLCARGEISADGAVSHGGPPLYRLTAAGVEAHEAAPDFGPQAARNLRMLRLRVMQALDLGRPQPMGTRLISLSLAEDTDIDLSEPSLRRALRYLAERGLVEAGTCGRGGDGARLFTPAAACGADDDVTWRITAAGIDYLASDGAAVAGVALPARW